MSYEASFRRKLAGNRITYRDTITSMAKAISVRLDDEALKALRLLEATGLSRSEAMRKALVDSVARLRTKEALRAEARSLEEDEIDRGEMIEVAAMMETLRAPR